MKNTLADFNLFYSIFSYATNFGTRCHYRKIEYRGCENIPEGEHYIIAPCHQNALMEPMLVLNMLRKPVVFLARADIFKKPVTRFFLNWLRISPVYRIRDGRDQLGRNEEIFNNAREVIEKNMPLCLMAEGRHNNRHQLLPLVKGMFRIAGATQAELGDKPLYILPVGIDYDDYEQPMSNVVVYVGKPIDVRSFMEAYNANQPVALNQMRDALTVSLKAQMHHVESQEHYDEEYAYCHLKTQDTLHELKLSNTAWGRFQARQHISQQMSQLTDEERAQRYAEGAAFAQKCRKKRVPMWFAAKKWTSTQTGWTLVGVLALVMLISWLDVWKYWFLSNFMVYLPTHIIPKFKIKDPQFRSSVNYGIRLVTQMLNVIVSTIVIWCVEGFWMGLLTAVLGIVSAWIVPRIFARLRDVWYSLK